MTQFQLSKQPRGQTTTRFHVLADDDSICGIITVPNEATDDLERHWLSAPAPRATAGKENSAVAAMVAAAKRQGAPSRATTAGNKENPAVAAMLKAAKRNPLNKQAILRGC